MPSVGVHTITVAREPDQLRAAEPQVANPAVGPVGSCADGDLLDEVLGLGGNDTIFAGGGPDTLNGGDGNDRVFGGRGNDVLRGDRGADRLEGEAGADQLFGGIGRDSMLGGPGNDRLLARDGYRDVVDGGSGFDVLTIDRFDTAVRVERRV